MWCYLNLEITCFSVAQLVEDDSEDSATTVGIEITDVVVIKYDVAAGGGRCRTTQNGRSRDSLDLEKHRHLLGLTCILNSKRLT